MDYLLLLHEEGFRPQQVAPLLEECRTIKYATTTDHSMIGSANELVKNSQFWLGQLGSLATPNLTAINRKLNRILMKHSSYGQAIEATRVLLRG